MTRAKEDVMPDTAERNKEVVRLFFETLSAGDLERLRDLFHEHATWTVVAHEIPGAGDHHGRDAIVDGFLAPIRGRFAPGDPKVDINNLVAEGPWVAVEARGRGHVADGTVYDNNYVFFLELDKGKVRTLREYMDTQYVTAVVGT
jgi:ketosteroid isomerase-like protein